MSKIEPREYELKNGERVIVREAVISDAESLLGVLNSIVAEDEYNVTNAEDLKKMEMTLEKEQEWIKDHIEKAGSIILVAELDGQVTGVLNVENGNRERIEHVGELHISVLKEFRNNGIGTTLMERAVEWAKQDKLIEKLSLDVFETNGRAMGLYEKTGFVKEGRRVKQIKLRAGEYIDSILMYRFVNNRVAT